MHGKKVDLFRHGGAVYWRPTAGAFNTFWNCRLRFTEYVDRVHVGKEREAPRARFIGLRGNAELRLDYGPEAHVEGLNREGIAVPSLHRHQIRARREAER